MWIIIIVVGFIIDRYMKIWAVNALMGGHEIEIVKGYFTLSYLENTGAAFGIFKGNFIFLYVMTSIMILSMILYIVIKKPKSMFFKIALGLVLAGAIGNMYDRLTQQYVVDFIQWHYLDKYYFPTFNCADVFLSVGTCLLALYFIKEDNDGKDKVSLQKQR